jgi:ribosomal protein L30E
MDIKNAIETKKLVIGFDEVSKALRSKTLKEVYYANNLPEDKIKEVQKYAELSGITAENANVPNDELGVICKKGFAISVLGIKK